MIPLWWRVLDRPAHGDEELEPLPGGEPLAVAVLVDRDAVDQLHDEERPAAVGGAGVEDPRDVRVVHQGQGLALGLEAGDDLLGVHARLDDLERDLAMDRALLLGEEDDAHAALAELADDRVGADARAGPLGDRAGRVRFSRAGSGPSHSAASPAARSGSPSAAVSVAEARKTPARTWASSSSSTWARSDASPRQASAR